MSTGIGRAVVSTLFNVGTHSYDAADLITAYLPSGHFAHRPNGSHQSSGVCNAFAVNWALSMLMENNSQSAGHPMASLCSILVF